MNVEASFAGLTVNDFRTGNHKTITTFQAGPVIGDQFLQRVLEHVHEIFGPICLSVDVKFTPAFFEHGLTVRAVTQEHAFLPVQAMTCLGFDRHNHACGRSSTGRGRAGLLPWRRSWQCGADLSGGSSSGSHGKFGAHLRHVLGDETGIALFGQAIGNIVLFHQAQEEGIEVGVVARFILEGMIMPDLSTNACRAGCLRVPAVARSSSTKPMALVSHSGLRMTSSRSFSSSAVVDDVAEVVHEVGEGLGVDSAQAACGANSAKGRERDARFGAGEQFVAGGFPVAVEAHPHLFEF